MNISNEVLTFEEALIVARWLGLAWLAMAARWIALAIKDDSGFQFSTRWRELIWIIGAAGWFNVAALSWVMAVGEMAKTAPHTWIIILVVVALFLGLIHEEQKRLLSKAGK